MIVQHSTNTVVKPSTKASAWQSVVARCMVGAPVRSDAQARGPMYAGTSGSTHGEKNESTPAPKARTALNKERLSISNMRLRGVEATGPHKALDTWCEPQARTSYRWTP